ncbi:MAG: hypothetical protein ACI9CV_001135 [Ilumatobacter sp.]
MAVFVDGFVMRIVSLHGRQQTASDNFCLSKESGIPCGSDTENTV